VIRRTAAVILPSLAVLLLTAAPAPAKLTIAISDQNPSMFGNRHFRALHIHHARIVVPWNVAQRHDYWPRYLRAWLRGARHRHVQPHVAFNIASFDKRHRGKGPSPKRFLRAFKRFRHRYRSVRVFTPWNEANHSFQPTFRKPKLAWRYYRVVRRHCRRCTVLAADLLDDSSMRNWMRRFKRYYRGRGPWGLHNYQDANKHRSYRHSATRRFARMVRGPIWITESGGIVGFKTIHRRVAYRYSVRRQLRAQRHLFRLLHHRGARSRYKRVYIYNYYGTWTRHRRTNRWDSGLLNLNGRPRPAYRDLRHRQRHRR
jgi:hypothetical protein